MTKKKVKKTDKTECSNQIINAIRYAEEGVYTEKRHLPKFDKLPSDISLFYISLDDKNRLAVDHYTYRSENPIEYKNVELTIRDIVISIRNVTQGKEQLFIERLEQEPYNNFENIFWTSPSYVAFVIDEESWSLEIQEDSQEALRYVVEEKRFGTTSKYSENYSFFDGHNFPLKASLDGRPANSVPAFFMINHYKKDEHGNPISEEEDQKLYRFEIYLRVDFARRSHARASRKTVILDPTSGNGGPPAGGGG